MNILSNDMQPSEAQDVNKQEIKMLYHAKPKKIIYIAIEDQLNKTLEEYKRIAIKVGITGSLDSRALSLNGYSKNGKEDYRSCANCKNWEIIANIDLGDYDKARKLEKQIIKDSNMESLLKTYPEVIKPYGCGESEILLIPEDFFRQDFSGDCDKDNLLNAAREEIKKRYKNQYV